MAKVGITNSRKDVFVFTLYHDVYCANGATCNCTRDNILRPVAGGLKYHEVINPVGVYLEGGETQNFDEAVLKIQQVQTGISQGFLKQVKVEDTPSSITKVELT